jgi:hypothetical protein
LRSPRADTIGDAEGDGAGDEEIWSAADSRDTGRNLVSATDGTRVCSRAVKLSAASDRMAA